MPCQVEVFLKKKMERKRRGRNLGKERVIQAQILRVSTKAPRNDYVKKERARIQSAQFSKYFVSTDCVVMIDNHVVWMKK